MKKLPPCREPSERLNHPGSSVSPISARGRDKDRILYGLAILLMAASMAGEEDARPGRKENHDYKIYRSGQMSKLRENGIER